MSLSFLKRIIIVIVTLFAFSLLGFLTWSHSSQTNPSDSTFVTTLKAKDGSVSGSVYVTYLNKNVFTSLSIVQSKYGKDAVVYKINSDGFFNTTGRDGEVTSKDFYGYKFMTIQDNYFAVQLLTSNGTSGSDSTNIIWNQDKGVFEIQRPDIEDKLVSIGTLSARNGATLGKVFVLYQNQNDKSILSGLYVVSTTQGKTIAIYRINEEGFFNLHGKEDDVPTNFRGFKLLYLKNDRFAVGLINSDGSTSDKVIQWDYDRQDFELEK